MKTFTAKQFSRTPGKVFDAARDDGKVEITHGANKTFELTYLHEEIASNETIVIDEECIKQFGIDMASAIKSTLAARRKLIENDLVPKDQLTDEEKGPEGPNSD